MTIAEMHKKFIELLKLHGDDTYKYILTNYKRRDGKYIQDTTLESCKKSTKVM